jgi:hypothetical protein
VPEFVTQGLIDHDYTMLVMRRYAEAMKCFWTEIIGKVKNQSNKALSSVGEFVKTEMRSYKEARKNFENNQARYDAVLSRYASVSKNKEPSSLREDAFQLSEAHKAYIKSCFDLCCIISTVQRQLDTLIIDSLTEPWLLKTNSLSLSDPTFHLIGIDMHRIKSWSKAVASSLKPIEAEMFRVRKEMEEATVTKMTPSRDLNDYTPQMSTISHFVPDSNNNADEKHGWLFVKSSVKPARQVWVRRWGFVKNGMFGWLVLSPNKTYVQESDKIGVLLCNVSPEPNEDRRFCFEIRTKDNTLIVQAETLADLKSWLQVFEVSKRLVLQKERDADMSFAFQKLPPLFPEFASTAGTSVDTELVHARTHSDSSANANSQQVNGATNNVENGGAISTGDFLTTQEASTIQELMTSGKNLMLSPKEGEKGSSCFSTIGPYSMSLAPSPLVNCPMPTSMTQESIISNAFITPTRVPTAVTANYWGSVNWSLYQTTTQISSRQEDKTDPSSSKLAPLTKLEYPGYYPYDLRSQDAQMRAIFQTLVDDDPMDKVVMVFRGMLSPNPKQELPARIFVTPRNIYMYAHIFGFAGLVKRPLDSFVSVEGHASTSWDTLYLLTDNGTSGMCRIFLDSGRMIQKRLQLLIDLKTDDSSDDLKTIISKLKKAGMEMKKEITESGPSGDYEDGDEDNASITVEDTSEEGLTNKKLMQKYLVGNKKTKPSRESIARGSQAVSPTQIDLSNTMDKKVIDKEYDVSAKTLFHIIFGEKSPVFQYTDSSLYRRDDLVVSAWKYNNAHHLEREISYVLKSNGVLMGSGGSGQKVTRVANLQRVEKMDENVSYIVYDRRTPWELPHGDVFYIATRFVVTSAGKTKSRLAVYVSVEWIRSRTLMKNVVESLVYHHFTIESKTIAKRISESRDKLGKRGMAVTAVRMFGKLGSPASKQTEGQIDAANLPVAATVSSDQAERDSPSLLGRPIVVSRFRMFQALYEFTTGWVISVFSSVVMLFTGGVEKLWKEVSFNRFILLALFASVAMNVILSGMTTKAYWSEKSAVSLSKNIHMVPTSDSVMKRSIYISDLNDLINEGRDFADEPDGICYQKFKSLVHLVPFDNDHFDLSDYDVIPANGVSLDKRSLAFSRKVHRMRNEVGFRRNRLLVTMKLLDRIERDMILSEWRNWLVSELELCSNVKKDISLMGENSSDEINSLADYCNSCLSEWTSTFQKNDF